MNEGWLLTGVKKVVVVVVVTKILWMSLLKLAGVFFMISLRVCLFKLNFQRHFAFQF